MARSTYEGMILANPEKRPFVLTRAGHVGSQRYAATWTGDYLSSWIHLWMSIPMWLNFVLYPVPRKFGNGGYQMSHLLWIQNRVGKSCCTRNLTSKEKEWYSTNTTINICFSGFKWTTILRAWYWWFWWKRYTSNVCAVDGYWGHASICTWPFRERDRGSWTLGSCERGGLIISWWTNLFDVDGWI